MRFYVSFLTFLVAFFFISSAAQADSLYLNPKPASTWVISVGGMAKMSPAFDGSKQWGPGFSPSFSWHKPGEKVDFSAPEDSIGLGLYQNKFVKIGLAGALDMGRFHTANSSLNGVHDVKWTVQGGAFVELWPVEDRLRMRMEILHGFRGTDGLLVNLSADYVYKVGRWTLSGGPRVTIADHMYQRSRFGITPADALTSAYKAFDPKGGVKSVGVGFAERYEFNKSWTGTLYQHYDRLTGFAAASPLVRQGGSRNQFTFGVGLVYSFDFGW